jgi:hypothetical protein
MASLLATVAHCGTGSHVPIELLVFRSMGLFISATCVKWKFYLPFIYHGLLLGGLPY